MTPEEITALHKRWEIGDVNPSDMFRLFVHIATQAKQLKEKDRHIIRLGGVLPGSGHRHSQDGVSGE